MAWTNDCRAICNDRVVKPEAFRWEGPTMEALVDGQWLRVEQVLPPDDAAEATDEQLRHALTARVGDEGLAAVTREDARAELERRGNKKEPTS